jgi:uncharacterized protein (TIGR03663 family)
MNKTVTLCLLLTVAIALALRCPQPGARPMHSDEAVNTIKFRELWEHGYYKYDPAEFHGPTLPYFTLAWAKLTGAPRNFAQFDEAIFRTVTVLFGIGLILFLPLIADGLGPRAALCAALLTAVSPAMVFYSRYYIHEMLLTFFTFLALAAGWRYTRSGSEPLKPAAGWGERTREPKLAWAVVTGAALGFMQATKETFLFAVVAAAIAMALNEFWMRRIDATAVPAPLKFKLSHLAAGALAGLAVAITLFSSFFSNRAGLLDSFRTYLPWTHRVEGASPHIHPWNFYFARLIFYHTARGQIWSEGLILILAIVGIVAVFRHKLPAHANANFVRFIALYTVVLTAIYCAIPYKTPWCLLSFWHGMILLAGVGAMTLIERASSRGRRVAFAALLLIGAGQLSLEAWQASVLRPTKPGNPYAYSQTSPNVLELAAQMEALSRANPLGHQMVIKVMAPEAAYWPLPWYLRDFTNIGWYSQIPPDPYASVMIVSKNFDANLDANKTHIMSEIYALRPDSFFELYVETNLWNNYLRTRPPEP